MPTETARPTDRSSRSRCSPHSWRFSTARWSTSRYPRSVAEFGGGLALQQWVIDGYLLTLGALILVAGAVSDQFGRLSVLRMGVAVFAVSLAAVRGRPRRLGAGRPHAACRASGAAFLVPSSLAMINARFSGADQARAIGTWTAWTGTAFVVGPPLGGVLVDALSWRWVFGINIVPLAVTLYLTTKLAPDESRSRPIRPRRRRRCGADRRRADRLPCTRSSKAAAGLLQHRGGRRLVLGVACLVAFPWWEHRAANPMMPLRIFAARNFAVGNLATVFLYAAVSLGTLIVASVPAGDRRSMSATEAGLATLPIPVLSFFLARRFGTLAGRHGPRAFMAVGPLVAAVGFRRMTMARAPFDFWTQMLPGLIGVRARPVDHGVAADGGDPRRGRPGAERYRFGGQQRRVADRRPHRDCAHRRDHLPGRAKRRDERLHSRFRWFSARRMGGCGAVRRRGARLRGRHQQHRMRFRPCISGQTRPAATTG